MRLHALLLLLLAAGLVAGETTRPTFALAKDLQGKPSAWPASPGHHFVFFDVTVDARTFRMCCGVFLPNLYFDRKKHPLPSVCFLHTAAQTGDTGEGLVFEGLPMFLAKGLQTDPRFNDLKGKMTKPTAEFPLVAISPQCPNGLSWESAEMQRVVPALMDEATRNLKAMDPDRCYLTGFSYGGTHTWTIALADPTPWAGIIPIAGRAPADPDAAAKILTRTAVVMMSGENDGFKEHQTVIAKALEKAGAPRAKALIAPGGGHWCYMYLYGDPAFWAEMVKVRRMKR